MAGSQLVFPPLQAVKGNPSTTATTTKRNEARKTSMCKAIGCPRMIAAFS
jgi:hypothetical protein